MKSRVLLCVFLATLLAFLSSCTPAVPADPDGAMTISLVYGTPAGVYLYTGREEGPDKSWPFVTLKAELYDVSMDFYPTAISAKDSAITDYYIRRYTGAEFASLGQVAGLGAITEKPTSGWASATAVEANCGYVVRFKHSYNVAAPGLPYYYYRMYVENVLTDIYGGFAGAVVRYQGPF